MNYIIDGVNYHVEIRGEGFPFVLFHGFTGDTTTWEPFYDQWGKNRQVISIDII